MNEEKTIKTGHEHTICPSCGRYVGPYEICPYCQASLKTRMSIKIFKWIAIWGSILGLILLWLGIKYKEVPLVKIGSINIQYNMAVVKLQGKVISIKKDIENDSFRIKIDDGTGTATLSGYGKLKSFQKALGDNFPRIGDEISAIGNVSVSEAWGITIFLSSPGRLKLISRSPIKKYKLQEITHDKIGKTGYFSGKITSVKKFAKLMSIELDDGSGKINLVIFNSQLDLISNHEDINKIKEGNTLEFLGKVSSYRGKLQLKLVDPDIKDNFKIIEENPEQNNE